MSRCASFHARNAEVLREKFQVFKSAHKACDTIQITALAVWTTLFHLMDFGATARLTRVSGPLSALLERGVAESVSAPALESGSASMRYESAAGVDNPLVDLGVLARATRRILMAKRQKSGIPARPQRYVRRRNRCSGGTLGNM